jgi:ParB family chromosome partitioning protein
MSTAAQQTQQIEVDFIDVSGFNTRKDLESGSEDSTILDLAESISRQGLLNPPTVRRKGDRFDLIAGQRRFLACKKLGWKTIPCFVRDDLSDDDATAISLVENVHRAEMNPMDKANALQNLLDHNKGDLQKVIKETGIGSQTIKRYLALRQLPEELQEKISTAEGPVKVQSMSMLVKTFPDKGEMLEVYGRIAGFTQQVQTEIIKQSEGDLAKVDGLVQMAHQGVFHTVMCKGVHDCGFVPEWIQVMNDSLNRRDDKITDTEIRDIMVEVRKYVEIPEKKIEKR